MSVKSTAQPLHNAHRQHTVTHDVYQAWTDLIAAHANYATASAALRARALSSPARSAALTREQVAVRRLRQAREAIDSLARGAR